MQVDYITDGNLGDKVKPKLTAIIAKWFKTRRAGPSVLTNTAKPAAPTDRSQQPLPRTGAAMQFQDGWIVGGPMRYEHDGIVAKATQPHMQAPGSASSAAGRVIGSDMYNVNRPLGQNRTSLSN